MAQAPKLLADTRQPVRPNSRYSIDLTPVYLFIGKLRSKLSGKRPYSQHYLIRFARYCPRSLSPYTPPINVY
jgi:hypothetical protein